jgi:Mg2+ and Co2+ transporter CorA
MPELTWRYGYFIVLAEMVTIGGALAVAFRRFGWW